MDMFMKIVWIDFAQVNRNNMKNGKLLVRIDFSVNELQQRHKVEKNSLQKKKLVCSHQYVFALPYQPSTADIRGEWVINRECVWQGSWFYFKSVQPISQMNGSKFEMRESC